MKTRNKYYFQVAPGKIIRISYNESPAHVGRLKHSVDFIVAEGTPIKAAADGEVIEIKQDSDVGGTDKRFDKFGNYLEIKHANNEYSEYEHLRKDGVIVKIGDKIKRGEIIGYSGATGYLAHLGPHLHFMVGKYGKTIKDYQTLEIIWRKN